MMTISVTGAKDLSLALQTVAEPLPASSSPNFAGKRRPNSDKPEINPPFRADIKRLREFIERNASKAALKIADILLAEAGSFFHPLASGPSPDAGGRSCGRPICAYHAPHDRGLHASLFVKLDI